MPLLIELTSPDKSKTRPIPVTIQNNRTLGPGHLRMEHRQLAYAQVLGPAKSMIIPVGKNTYLHLFQDWNQGHAGVVAMRNLGSSHELIAEWNLRPRDAENGVRAKTRVRYAELRRAIGMAIPHIEITSMPDPVVDF